MKRILLTIISALFVLAGHAQEDTLAYHPFIEEGKVWECAFIIPFADEPTAFESYYFDGDTIISQKPCKKLMKQYSSVSDSVMTVSYVAALFEIGGRVWKFNRNSNVPELLYDFSVQAGDSMVVSNTPCYVNSVPMVNIHGVPLRCVCFRDDWDEQLTEDRGDVSNNFWIEGIGTTTLPFDCTIHGNGVGCNWYLRRCTVGDVTIYTSRDNPISILADINRDVIPHPFIQDKKEWIVGSWNGKNYTALKTFYFGADTIIAETTCKKFMCLTEFLGGEKTLSYKGALFEHDRRVYGFAENESSPRLLYDFSIRPGDTLAISRLDANLTTEDYFHVIPEYRYSHFYKGEAYRAFDIYHDGNRPDPIIEVSGIGTIYVIGSWGNIATWIEGVGSEASPLCNIRLSTDKDEDKLVQCSIGGCVIYEKKEELIELQEQIREGLHIMRTEGNNYRPFIEKGKIWKTIIVDHMHSLQLQPTTKAVVEYYLDGDTIIGGRNCTRMMWRSRRPNSNKWTSGLLAPIYEEGHKVYFFPVKTSTPRLMYDFDVKAGDTIQVRSPQTYQFPTMLGVSGKTTNLTIRGFSDEIKGGQRHTVLWYEPIPHSYPLLSDFWISGVGSISNPVKNGEIYLSFDNVSLLIECRVGDELLYHDDSYNNLMDSIGFYDSISSYRPFIEDGKVWRTGINPGSGFVKCYEYRLYGDTIIDGKTCKMLGRSEMEASPGGIYSPIDTVFVGALYEEGRKVYGSNSDMNHLELLYDFASPVGTDVTISGDVLTIIRKEQSKDEAYKGELTYIQLGEAEGAMTFWMEGVGGLSHPLESLARLYPTGLMNEQLLSCYVGDEAIYLRRDWNDPIDPEVKKQWLDFTHTVKPRPKSPRKKESSLTPDPSPVGEGNLTGEYSDKDLLVSLVPLSGPYTVTLTDAGGEEVYVKTVQTSSVVALNTDLSKYPAGSYTLTVENADEAYTATLTIGEGTAIRNLSESPNNGLVPSSKFNVPSSQLFDLSGRRLSAPPSRGVYINGGKVKTIHN